MAIVIGVYRITCLRNNKVYIGSSFNVKKRWSRHRCSLRKGDHHCIRLQRSWNKYGEKEFVFDIVELVSNKNELRNREQYWLDKTKASNPSFGFNSSPDAERNSGRKWTEEQRARHSKIMTGRRLSTNHKQNISNGLKSACRGTLSKNAAFNVIKLWNGGKSLAEISERIGCSKSAAHRVLKRRTFTDDFSYVYIRKFSRKGTQHHNANITEDDVRKIKKSEKSGVELAKLFGVSPNTIYDIKKERTWSHV